MSTIGVSRIAPTFNMPAPAPEIAATPSPATAPSAPQPTPPAPDAGKTSLRELRLHQQLDRGKREAPSPAVEAPAVRRRYPAAAVATNADATLQKHLVQWLNTGVAKDNRVPPNASIAPFIGLYNEAISDPTVQAWFKSKGLKLSTVRVFSDSVVGVVVRDGKESIQRFTTTDGSGWWEVGANVSAAHKALSPSDLGIPVAPGPTQAAMPRDVMLDFYGVTPPRNEKAAPQLGKQLKREGWPEISAARRGQWEAQFKRLQQSTDDQAVRGRLVTQLQPLLKGKKEGDDLKLDQHTVTVEPGAALDQRSKQPRKAFGTFLASEAFQAFLKKTGFAGQGSEFRLSEGDLQLRNSSGQWMSLQAYFDDEVEKTSGAGSAAEQQAARKMNDDFDQLVEMSRATGNALYSTRTYDARQVLAFYAPDAPDTVNSVRATLAWFDTRLPPPPLAADYAGMTPYAPAQGGGLSPKDTATLKGFSADVMALFRGFVAGPVGSQSPGDPDRQLAAFFDSPQSIAKANEMAKALKLYGVADGQALSRAERHQLLATVLKLSVDAPVPGKPGTVAGYALYQPSNLGRTLKEVRADVETHLQGQGVDPALAPLMAHLFLAQAAPEMLIKADPGVPADDAQALNRDPQSIRLGSTGWLEMRLGCGIADSLSGPGSSRLMNLTQIMALSRLEASGPTQETLLKSLGAQPLLDWAVMAGVFPMTSDGQYSPGDYQAAAQAFTERENATHEAFATLTREPPTQLSVLLKQLTVLFPELTEDELRNVRLELDTDKPFNPRQHAHLETRQPLLTDVILTEQAEGDPLLAADKWLNDLISGKKKYNFIHPKISQETFNERIKQLPKIAPLVAPAVDQHIADTRTAQATALKLMIAQLPLNERKALELGQIEFFSVRKETGDDLEADKGPGSNVAKNTGKHGLLLRYETGAVEPRFGYYEVFPGSMKMVKRDDLPYQLPLDGEVKEGQKPFGPFAYTRANFRKGTPQPFDFEAYSSGSEPQPGKQSTVIIEKLGSVLPATPLPGKADNAIQRVPNSFASPKTAQIVNALQTHTFDDNREALIEYANQPSKLHSRRTWPFTSGKAFNAENVRMVLSLIPFVGAIADVAEGKVKEGLQGLLIDFASFAATGGLAGARRVLRGVKMLTAFNGKPFTMTGLKHAGALFRSLFNPLDGVVDVLKSGPNALNMARKILKGEVTRVGSGIYMPTTAFEKCRWAVGAKDTLAGEADAPSHWPGSRLGTHHNRELYAVQKNGGWYAINPQTCKPEGAPLEQFTPQA